MNDRRQRHRSGRCASGGHRGRSPSGLRLLLV